MPAEPDLPSIEDPYTGETRYLGSLPTDPRLVAALAPYVGDVLPESELREFNVFPHKQIKIQDQNGKGACNGFATAAAVEGARFVAGRTHVPLSGWYPYSILCNGVDRGSNILQAYKLTMEQGIAPEDTVEYGTINPRKLTAEAHLKAKNYRLEFGTTFTTFRQMVSATMLQQCGNFSICVGRTFNNLDGEGVPGVDRGQGNHAVSFGLGLKKSSRWGWLILMRNSWSTRWGQEGFCWIAEAHVESASYFECFSVNAVVSRTDDEEPPPIVKALDNLPRKTTWKPPKLMG